MSRYVTIDVVGRPSPKGSPRVVTRGRGGAPLPCPRVLKDSRNTEEWHACVAEAAVAAMEGRVPFVGMGLRVEVTFYLRRPKGHYGVRGLKPSAPRHPAVKPDLDKLVRATMDPLEGVVFDGDSRIVEFLARKRYAALGEPERATISVAPGWAGSSCYFLAQGTPGEYEQREWWCSTHQRSVYQETQPASCGG